MNTGIKVGMFLKSKTPRWIEIISTTKTHITISKYNFINIFGDVFTTEELRREHEWSRYYNYELKPKEEMFYDIFGR